MPAQCSARRGESDLGFGSESDGEEEEGKEERKEGGKEGTLTVAGAATKPVKKMQSCYATGVAVGRESTATGSH